MATDEQLQHQKDDGLDINKLDLGGVGDWFDNLDFFGTKKTERANAAAAAAQKQKDEAFNAAKTSHAKQSAMSEDSYNRGTQYGDQAADWINTGGQSGKLASQAGAQAGGVAGGTARSLGLNAAQAAKQGGQQGASTYGDMYKSIYGMGAGTLSGLSGQYLNSSAAQGGLANQSSSIMSGAGLGGMGTAAGQQAQGAGQTSGALSGIVSTVLSLVSDKDAKKEIRDSKDILNHVFSKVNPKTFKYKDNGPGADGEKEHVGIMAQDLEKTPLAGAVKNGPEGKTIDVGQLTAGNTAMIGELNKKLEKMMEYIKAAK